MTVKYEVDTGSTRRAFLKGTAGFAAIAALPSAASDLPSEEPASDAGALECHHIKAGALRPFSLLHVFNAEAAKIASCGDFALCICTGGGLRVFPADKADCDRVGEYNARETVRSETVCGVNFVTLDNSDGVITKEQSAGFERETEKGLPVILVLRRALNENPASGNSADSEFAVRLKNQPLLKGILSGSTGCSRQNAFSPGVKEFAVGGGSRCCGERIVIS